MTNKYLSYATCKKVAGLLGATIPSRINDRWLDEDQRTWFVEEEARNAGENPVPALCLEDIISKPFCEAIALSCLGQRRYHARIHDELVSAWYYGDLSELELELDRMVKEAPAL